MNAIAEVTVDLEGLPFFEGAIDLWTEGPAYWPYRCEGKEQLWVSGSSFTDAGHDAQMLIIGADDTKLPRGADWGATSHSRPYDPE
jgi:hypothetical protein